MDLFFNISFFITVVIIANILAEAFPKIPLVIWQILGGVLLALLPFVQNALIDIPSHYFMMLIVAPLLYYEGQKTTFKNIAKNFSAIFHLTSLYAILIMALIMLATIFIFHFPWPIGLILAAIVTPTDAVALQSTTNNLEIPKGIKKALTLESLFNDATGLVVLELGLIWFKTGDFSFPEAIGAFLISAFGGALAGFVLGGLVVLLRRILVTRRLSDELSQVLIQIGTPIIIYFLSEEIHVSGIVAVVVAGLFSNFEQTQTQLSSPKTTNTVNTIWRVFADFLNAIVFVFLGFEMTLLAISYSKHESINLLISFFAAVVIYLVMFILRKLIILRTNNKNLNKILSVDPDRKQDAAIFAYGGVHGAVAIAMAFSLPKEINGQPFDLRYQLLVIVSFVVIISLLMPMFRLGKFAKEIKPDFSIDEMHLARDEMLHVGMENLNKQKISKQAKIHAKHRLRRQIENDEAEDINKRLWHEYASKVYKVRDDAIKEAINEHKISVEATNLYLHISKMQQKMKQVNPSAILRFKMMIMPFFQRFRKQRSRVAVSPDGEQQRVVLEDNKEYIPLFKELNDVSQKPVAKYIDSLKKNQELNPMMVDSLRGLVTRDTDEWNGVVTSDDDVNKAVLDALYAQSVWLTSQRKEKKINAKLGEELYEDISASQHLIKSSMENEDD